MKNTQSLMVIVFAFCLLSVLLLVTLQISVATSLRECSPIETFQYSTNGSNEVWKVASESMYPLLLPGDIVAVGKGVGFLDVHEGDIIVFKEPVPDDEVADAIISRVNEILIDPVDQLVLVTKGDANSGSIPGIDFPIYESDYIGTVHCYIEEGDF